MTFQAVVFFLLLSLSFQYGISQQASNEATGISVKLNPSGFQFVRQQFSRSYSTLTSQISFKPITGGSWLYSYNLNNFQITELDLEVIFNAQAPNILTVGFSRGNFGVGGSISASVLFSSFSGRFDFGIHDVSLSQNIRILRDDQNKLKLSQSGECTVNIARISHQFQFDSSYINRLASTAANTFDNTIRGLIQRMACNFIDAQLADDSYLMGLIPDDINLPFNTSVDVSLARPPATSRDTLTLDFNGRIFPTFFPSLVSNTASQGTPRHTISNKMVQLAVNEFVINTFFQSIAHNGMLSFEVTPQRISAILSRAQLPSFSLTLGLLAAVKPALSVYDQNSTSYVFVLQPITPPEIAFNNGSFSVSGSYNLRVKITQEDGIVVQEDVLQLNFGITLAITVDGRYINVEIGESNINFGSNPFPTLLFLQPQMNLILRNAFANLPDEFRRYRIPAVAGYYLDGMEILFNEGYFNINSNIGTQ